MTSLSCGNIGSSESIQTWTVNLKLRKTENVEIASAVLTLIQVASVGGAVRRMYGEVQLNSLIWIWPANGNVLAMQLSNAFSAKEVSFSWSKCYQFVFRGRNS